ncbi:hypothetical protein ACO2Q8_07955 [Larkinella sp. VNQ87]|uniref:hypothetical protein n=1 Tax=Larkinella sp. VNQ87 TaxID=3400921 RepID=UPI003C03BA0C
MNVNYGFTLQEVFSHFNRGTLRYLETDRLRDMQDLLLWQIDAVEEYIYQTEGEKVCLVDVAESLRLFRRISDEIATILTAEFYALKAA